MSSSLLLPLSWPGIQSGEGLGSDPPQEHATFPSRYAECLLRQSRLRCLHPPASLVSAFTPRCRYCCWLLLFAVVVLRQAWQTVISDSFRAQSSV